MKKVEQIKNISYDADMPNRIRAKKDKEKIKKSPDIAKKKYTYYDPISRCTFYADKKKVLNNMIRELTNN